MDTSKDESFIFVLFASDTKTHKFKMMLKGDVGTLSVVKVKRYLQKATGVAEMNQVLRFRGREVSDTATGADFGLHNGDELTLHAKEASVEVVPPLPPPPTPELTTLREEVTSLRSQLSTALRAHHNPLRGQPLAERSLLELSRVVGGTGLAFDANMSCNVQVRSCTVIVTHDTASERLYIYSTLLNALPRTPTAKIALYELLLEGALLGRDIAGGSVGISLRNDCVLLSTSVDLRQCDEYALRDIVPVYVECLLKWRSQLRYLIA